MARREHDLFFGPVPEFDVWYFDNVMKHSRVKQADWREDGVDVASSDAEVAAAYRRGHAAEWQAAAALAPGRLLMGNADNDLGYAEYRGQLQAAFGEGMMGKSWSLETLYGWTAMMQRYFGTIANLKAPALYAFNVHGAVDGSADSWRFFRYALCSCLLHNGHFSFTNAALGYSSVEWFDEYEVALGAALDAPTLAAWSNGVYRRRYRNALVLVNPQTSARAVNVGKGWRRLLARQDPVTNNGQPVGKLTIPAKDGLILVRV